MTDTEFFEEIHRIRNVYMLQKYEFRSGMLVIDKKNGLRGKIFELVDYAPSNAIPKLLLRCLRINKNGESSKRSQEFSVFPDDAIIITKDKKE